MPVTDEFALRRSSEATEPRTLVDVLRLTVERFGDDPAVDNGAVVLTYREFLEAAEELAAELAGHGIAAGDRVGIRIDSGTVDLYVAIAGVLVAGAAYVPVDVDDPDARARTVFDEAAVAAVIGNGVTVVPRRPAVRGPGSDLRDPGTGDDAWIIFTSGSTGRPKGVAVTHRSAAAFVDAEADLFCRAAPLGPGDRVMAGLSVAFDASCEEMWLAWRHGACLVPAPRSLVKSGTDLGPWMVANDITVVSTVPTLVSLWPPGALDGVRLLILGGEACPPEIGARLATDEREVWNTYGPTEATVVACAARLGTEPPVRIGLPLAGWDLAVVDTQGRPVAPGESGELIIGGVGLARYLDPEKDAAVYAPMPTLGWDRAYRSGDVVVNDPAGLIFVGRADEQIKLGGRRIELGELDSALLGLPGVVAAAAAVRTTAAGNRVLVGYVQTGGDLDLAAATVHLRSVLPAALVPRLATVDVWPTRTSGKVDRDALPWPLPVATADAGLTGTAAWLRDLWLEILGAAAEGPEADFFTLGGGSLSAAQLVARLREQFADVTVADVYEHPRLGDLATTLEAMGASTGRTNDRVRPVPPKTQAGQVLATVALRSISGLRWATWIGVGLVVATAWPAWEVLPEVSVPLVGLGVLLLISPPGRILLAAAAVRWILRGVGPGSYPRGGRIHLRLWLAERVVDEIGATGIGSAAWMRTYARLLGCRVGRGVDLHALPPVTGLLTLGDGCSIEPEVDLTGHWIDGGRLHVGTVHVGERARIGARSMLCDGAHVGEGAEVAPGSAVFGTVPAGEFWSGAPAVAVGEARGPADASPAPRSNVWAVAYGVAGLVVAGLPVVAVAVGLAVVAAVAQTPTTWTGVVGAVTLWAPVGAVVGFVCLAVLVWGVVRLASVRLVSGVHPVDGRVAWQAWTVLRVLDEARTWLFPLYSSLLTPWWLRRLGARIGRDVEASTVLMLPQLTSVGDGAFLADDTMLGMYELGGGWLRIERVKIGRRAFVGNSGMTAPGRKVPKGGLVAVLSAAPRRAKAKAGTSWLGSPPTQLRRAVGTGDDSRTFRPSRSLRVARGFVELARAVPVLLHVGAASAVVVVLLVIADRAGWWAAASAAGLVLVTVGAVAALLTTVAKWLLVGRVRVGDHPLWSWFVWRNELADTFVEVLAAPWFARHVSGTPVLNLWLRSLGAGVGRGVWCETYWLPEADLITIESGATVNRGCVVQTHLFHDRILSMDSVTLEAGATLGPHSVVLPAARLGRHCTIGPVSLVMRGETVPHKTRWIGNPIGPWTESAP
ncbi:non-ribosomal peptide synthetase C-terminal domain protein [Aeromicrobium marinum DSM 15272]|uniref:Non-ribosomal peptide synthetase C-terminal domain protein n=1 Tax=Aeromicrobium marinum DSM 15272 TaxID=585531 RepID=E2S9K5_9ACTN|nr:Pls/PosA family non-ribosomal peptide synthetase [Aeromicrobium marinum]EFQ83929.1 non-ribosomal peptide synthetase C-terminal domain protein [Aeromicrobium marinum DSM 15272]